MRDWLKQCRVNRGLTMKDMSKRLDISESYYSLIESGDRQKKLDIMLAMKLSAVLGVPINKIVEFENG